MFFCFFFYKKSTKQTNKIKGEYPACSVHGLIQIMHKEWNADIASNGKVQLILALVFTNLVHPLLTEYKKKEHLKIKNKAKNIKKKQTQTQTQK